MSASLDVAPLVGGIVEELLHLPRCLKPQILRVKTRALAFAEAGIGGIIVVSLLGAMPWRSGTPLGKVRLALLGNCFVGHAGRGLGTGVDVGVAASELSRFECRRFLLGRKCRRLVWCAASGPVWCV
jgi:hypothetical protein